MTLLELLVEELPGRGGWPNRGILAVQDVDKWICFSTLPAVEINGGEWGNNGGEWVSCIKNCEYLADDYSKSIITREQYEAALAASKQEWDGKFPIPAGTEVEVHFDGDDSRVWTRYRVEYMAGEIVVLHDYRIDNVDAYKQKTLSFRPVRSEADKKKEAVEKAIADALLKDGDFNYAEALRLSTFVYGAISRNEIPHIRID